MNIPRGIDAQNLEPWLEQHIAVAQPPFTYELIVAGGSNLSYRIKDSKGNQWALRRPPEGKRIATAHDMNREWQVIKALQNTPVPVPEAVALCEDEQILGAPFYVMEFVEGHILRSLEDIQGQSSEFCTQATESLIDVQVALHTLDFEAVGLGQLGKRDGYLQRQLKRWSRQVASDQVRDLPLLFELHDNLLANTPTAKTPVGIVHGDFRFDNTVLSDNGKICAVLDWELCTLGDVCADFAWSLMYWADPDDKHGFIPNSPTLYDLLPKRAQVAASYCEKTGFDLSSLDFYRAFSWWKMACIVEGVSARMMRGSAGGMGGSSDKAADLVDSYLEEAQKALTNL